MNVKFEDIMSKVLYDNLKKSGLKKSGFKIYRGRGWEPGDPRHSESGSPYEH